MAAFLSDTDSASHTRRVCSSAGCGKQISAHSLDPHSSCVKYRGTVCKLDSRYDKCKDWEEDVMLKDYKRRSSSKLRDKRRCKSSSS